MLGTLAFRHLLVRKRRSLFLLLGFALGVGVMIVLLSVGRAMLEQSRDVSLVGGGEVTVLPRGIDVEAMRTGGLTAMFFGIDRARFLTRQGLGGPRHAELVRAVSPAIEGKLLYLCKAAHQCRARTVRAGGDIPSRARAVGAGLDLRQGHWHDSAADSAWIAPAAQQLYDELDRFHIPPRPDSTWAEWQYYNFVTGPNEWWYVTFLVGGEVRPPAADGSGRWGGRMLVTHRRPDGRYERFDDSVHSRAVRFDTAGADLTIGRSSVRQRDGTYGLRVDAAGEGGRVRMDLRVQPLPNRYFPPVELREGDFISGYVVPALAADAAGTICVDGRCNRISDVPAYHDHNWGVWRAVTWDWGAARGARLALLYGGVYAPAATSPLFIAVVDSLGVRQVLGFDRIAYEGAKRTEGTATDHAPRRFTLAAARGADSIHVSVEVEQALATPAAFAADSQLFLQMRGRFHVGGRLAGAAVSDSGSGFFETYRTP
jgi:hypothetical protein